MDKKWILKELNKIDEYEEKLSNEKGIFISPQKKSLIKFFYYRMYEYFHKINKKYIPYDFYILGAEINYNLTFGKDINIHIIVTTNYDGWSYHYLAPKKEIFFEKQSLKYCWYLYLNDDLKNINDYEIFGEIEDEIKSLELLCDIEKLKQILYPIYHRIKIMK